MLVDLGVTALILTVSYRSQEFIRVGYYVHNQLAGDLPEDQDIDSLALSEIVSKIRRTIISDKPRITKFNIDWGEGKKDSESIMQEEGKNDELDNISQKSVNKESENQSTTEEKRMSIQWYLCDF